MPKLTKAQRKALEWFAAKSEPVKMFAAGDPSSRIRATLIDHGWLRKIRPLYFGFVAFEITDAGRAALQQKGKGS